MNNTFTGCLSGALLTALWLPGCGGIAVLPGDTVTVWLRDHYALDGVEADAPTDLADIERIEAYVQVGEGYDVYPAEIFDDGHAEIRGLPEGPYLLVVTHKPDGIFWPDGMGVITSAREVDLGENRVGRADVQRISGPAGLHLKGSLSSPWADTWEPRKTDKIAIYSREAGFYAWLYSSEGEVRPEDGSTSIDWPFDATAELGSAPGGLRAIDAAKGDVTSVVRMREESVKSDPVFAGGPWDEALFIHLADTQPPAAIKLAPGTTAVSDGAFTPTGSDVLFDVAFDAEASAPFAEAAAPSEVHASAWIHAVPASNFIDAGPRPLVLFLALWGVGSTWSDVVYPLQGKNPYPMNQDLVASMHVHFEHEIQDLPWEVDNHVSIGYGVWGPAEILSGAPLVPEVGPVRDLRIGHQAAGFDDEVSGVGTGPHVAWDPPSFGAPNRYVVTVSDRMDAPVAGASNTYNGAQIASFQTQETELLLPQSTLRPGHVHVISVVAYRDETPMKDDAPWQQQGEMGAYSALSSGIVMP